MHTPSALALSPDGKWLASSECCDGNTVRLWDLSTGKERARWPGHHRAVFDLAFSPDGKQLVSCGGDLRLCLRDVATGRETPDLPHPHHVSTVVSLCVPAEGKTLISVGGESSVLVWDLGRLGQARPFMKGQRTLDAFQCSADGKWLATLGEDNECKVWELSKEKPVHVLPGKPGEGGWYFLAADKKTLLLRTQRDVAFIELATGRTVRALKEGIDHRCSASFSGDGKRLALLASNHWIEVYDCLPFQLCWTLQLPFSEDGTARGGLRVAFSPDGQTLAFNNGDDRVHLREAIRGKPLDTLLHDGNHLTSFCWSPDGRFLATGTRTGQVFLWEAGSRKPVLRLQGHRDSVKALAFVGNRTLASGSADTTILLWDLTGKAFWPREQESPDELWLSLASEDATAAYQTVWQLVQSPEPAVSLIRKKLLSAVIVDRRSLERHVSELESSKFAVREAAAGQLRLYGLAAEPALRAALGRSPSLEIRRRIEGLLASLELRLWTGEQLRLMRAIHVLEALGTPAAKEHLVRLTKGDPAALLTREATAALKRLGQR
jgi:WD40 repeat protein